MLGYACAVTSRVQDYVARLDALRARPRADQIEDDVAGYRAMKDEERPAAIAAALKLAWSILSSRADKEAVLAQVDPPAPDYASIMRRLRTRRA